MFLLLYLFNFSAIFFVSCEIDETSFATVRQWTSIQPFISNYVFNKVCCSKANQSTILSEPNERYRSKYLKVVAVSDTHGFNDDLEKLMSDPEYNSGDVFIHAGDFTDFGESEELVRFNELLGKLNFTHKIVVAGNHELGFDPVEDLSQRSFLDSGRGTINGYSLLTNAVYLHDDFLTIDGVKFFGTPYHFLKGFPFYVHRLDEKELRVWNVIPRDVDVLITHTPPLGILDVFAKEGRWGSNKLLWKVLKYKPGFHVFGHVHAGYGAIKSNDTTFINAALTKPIFPPIGLDPERKPFVFYVRRRIVEKINSVDF